MLHSSHGNCVHTNCESLKPAKAKTETIGILVEGQSLGKRVNLLRRHKRVILTIPELPFIKNWFKYSSMDSSTLVSLFQRERSSWSSIMLCVLCMYPYTQKMFFKNLKTGWDSQDTLIDTRDRRIVWWVSRHFCSEIPRIFV